MIEAYFDESGTHDESEFMCVAGYIFEKEDADIISDKWQKMLTEYDLPHFRMSSCAHGSDVFNKLDIKQRIAVETEAIELIKSYMSYGFVVSIEMSSVDHIPKHGLYNSPYTFLCWMALIGVKRWADENKYYGDLAYFFESGATHQGEANNLMTRILSEPELIEEYRYASHTFADKAKLEPLQCADLLSWQWFTHLKKMQQKKPMRKDFYSLTEKVHFHAHFDEHQLRSMPPLPPLPAFRGHNT